jgi:probable phosphoglycerate mutase
MSWQAMLTAFIDGGSRGNPGPAGYGVQVVDEQGTVVQELSESIGVTTNNEAEYRGLIAALEWMAAEGHTRARIRSDSELLVEQMRGEYRVKSPGLQPLHREASQLVKSMERVVFEHVPREKNREADRLANEAMDRATKDSAVLGS